MNFSFVTSVLKIFINLIIWCVHAQSLQSHPALCGCMDCSLPGSSVHGILRARILEWVAISFSRGASCPRDQTCISCINRWILYHWATRKAQIPLLRAIQFLRTYIALSDEKKKRTESNQVFSSYFKLVRLPAMRETWVQSLGWEAPLEKETATHSSTLAGRIPWTVGCKE